MGLIKLVLLILLYFQINNIYASECWITGEYKGYSAKVYSDLKFSEDGMTKTNYVLNIDGERSQVIGSDIDNYLQIGERSILGISQSPQGTVIETWNVNKELKKVYFTKSISGYGTYDGVVAFVGDVLGECTSERELLKQELNLTK